MRRDIQGILKRHTQRPALKVISSILLLLTILLGILGIAVFPIVQQQTIVSQTNFDYPPYSVISTILMAVAAIIKLVLMALQINTWKQYFKLLLLTQVNFIIPYLFLATFIGLAVTQINGQNTFDNYYAEMINLLNINNTSGESLSTQFGIWSIDNWFIASYALQTFFISIVCCKKTITKAQLFLLGGAFAAALIYLAIVAFVNFIGLSAQINNGFETITSNIQTVLSSQQQEVTTLTQNFQQQQSTLDLYNAQLNQLKAMQQFATIANQNGLTQAITQQNEAVNNQETAVDDAESQLNSAEIALNVVKELLEKITNYIDQMKVEFEMMKDYFICILAVLFGYYLLIIDFLFRAVQGQENQKALQKVQEQLQAQKGLNTHQSESHRNSNYKDIQLVVKH